MKVAGNNLSVDHEEVYKQIRSPSGCWNPRTDFDLKLLLDYRCLFLLLILTTHTHALPIPAVGPSSSSSLPTSNIQWMSHSTTPSPMEPYRTYRHMPILLANVQPSYSNGGTVQLHSQRNFSQLRRERHRRAMIDRLLLIFDDDGEWPCRYFSVHSRSHLANGEFSKDEFYSFALRLNIFPRFHQYLKQTSPLN